MSQSKDTGDAAFERALLGAARRDADSPDVDQAWSQFSNRVNVVASGIEAASGVHALKPVGSRAERGSAGSSFSTLAGLRWFLAGALGGSVVAVGIFSWLHDHPEPGDRSPAVASGTIAEPGVASAKASAASHGSVVTMPPHARRLDSVGQGRAGESPAAVRVDSEEGTHVQPKRHEDLRPKASRRRVQRHDGVPASSLGAEVRAVDAARRASSSGDYEETLRQVARFHSNYPASVLAPDAEVIALEALRGLKRDTRTRARRFLSRYPNDPHVGKVEPLIE